MLSNYCLKKKVIKKNPEFLILGGKGKNQKFKKGDEGGGEKARYSAFKKYILMVCPCVFIAKTAFCIQK